MAGESTAANSKPAAKEPTNRRFNAGFQDLGRMNKDLYPELRSMCCGSSSYLHEPQRQGAFSRPLYHPSYLLV